MLELDQRFQIELIAWTDRKLRRLTGVSIHPWPRDKPEQRNSASDAHRFPAEIERFVRKREGTRNKREMHHAESSCQSV
jgi:hypothetical protein